MTDYDSIWRTQDEIRTVVNAVRTARIFVAKMKIIHVDMDYQN